MALPNPVSPLALARPARDCGSEPPTAALEMLADAASAAPAAAAMHTRRVILSIPGSVYRPNRPTNRQHINALSATKVERTISVAPQHPTRMSLHTATAVGSCAAPLSGLSFIGKTLTGNVRFTPKSGHSSGVAQCPLCANSGHFVAASL